MDETADEIEAQIDRTRERLSSNLSELEDRVHAATDWREHFRDRPLLLLGAAFVGGAMLATVLRPASPASERSHSGDRHLARGGTSTQAQALELWDNVKGALIGVASSRIREFIGALVPEFDEHYRRSEQRSAASDPTVGLGRRMT